MQMKDSENEQADEEKKEFMKDENIKIAKT